MYRVCRQESPRRTTGGPESMGRHSLATIHPAPQPLSTTHNSHAHYPLAIHSLSCLAAMQRRPIKIQPSSHFPNPTRLSANFLLHDRWLCSGIFLFALYSLLRFFLNNYFSKLNSYFPKIHTAREWYVSCWL
jgi:hypothetical protein